MNDDRHYYNNPYTAWGPMAPLIAPWIQAMQAWTCAMAAFAPGAMPRDSWSPFGCPTPSPNVSVRVISPYQTEVTPTLAPGAECMTLSAAELRIFDPPPDRVIEPLRATIVPGSRPVLVTVTVPVDQPPGRYRGSIVNNADGCTVGSLLVQIWGKA
jgi:hypothetical protein